MEREKIGLFIKAQDFLNLKSYILKSIDFPIFQFFQLIWEVIYFSQVCRFLFFFLSCARLEDWCLETSWNK